MHKTRVQFGLFLIVFLLAACGDADTSSTAPHLTSFAGNFGGPGDADGIGAVARFGLLSGVATDSAGNAYVADGATIRKVTPTGAVTTIAGNGSSGSADGAGKDASFAYPFGVATDSAGNIYVTDITNKNIRKITPSGAVTTLAGTAGVIGSVDGTGAAASFDFPTGITTDSNGNIYVTELLNNTIRKITPLGTVTTLAGTSGASGNTDGSGVTARFNGPSDIVTDSTNNLYVADSGNGTIRKISPNGLVTTLSTIVPVINELATDNAGNFYIIDNQAILKVTPSGTVTTLAGTVGVGGNIDGIGATARFLNPDSVATDSAGNVYVADAGNYILRRVSHAGVVTTIAGLAAEFGTSDGSTATATFEIPSGVAADGTGNVYVADATTVRKITSMGTVTTLAGSPGIGGNTDGIGAAASFLIFDGAGIAVDLTGNVYVADSGNDTIRRITPTGVVTTLAGTAGVAGSADGIGAAASFHLAPNAGVAADSAGNVYVADNGNDTIRKITPTGVVTTFAGTAGVSGSADGTGAEAAFKSPLGVATDDKGNVYVADGNETIRKITPTGVVSTLAGMAGIAGSADGIGATARFTLSFGIATDGAGNVYVVDLDDTIRKVTPAGVVSTIVGVNGKSTFEPGPLPGALYNPKYIAISGTSLYITSGQGVAVVRNLP